MDRANTEDAIFIGGPRDGARFASDGVALVELEIDEFVHRYIRTTAQRERDGDRYVVFNYDGVIDPSGAQSGVETR